MSATSGAARARIAVIAVIALAVAFPAAASAASDGKIHPDLEAALERAGATRAIVVLHDRADLRPVRDIASRPERRRAAASLLQRAAVRSQRRVLDLLGRAGIEDARGFWIANAVAVQAPGPVLRALAALPEVAEIVPDRTRTLTPAIRGQTAATSATWNVDRIGARQAWNAGWQGAGVAIGSLDTGVDAAHPAIAAKYRGASGGHDYDWWDAVSRLPVPYDDNGHGTHTTGIALGGDGPGPDLYDIGVAPAASWLAVKVFSATGAAPDSRILAGAQWLAAPTRLDGGAPRPDLAPDVVNNSWGGGECDGWFRSVLRNWRALDIFPVFAAGNSGPGAASVESPADEPGAVAAGATDSVDAVPSWSARGPSCFGETKPDLAAPGVKVLSSVPGGGYASWSGTSMAAPHVAGAAALMLQAAGGALTPSETESALRQTALDIGSGGTDNASGAGRIRAHLAAAAVAAPDGDDFGAAGAVTAPHPRPARGATERLAACKDASPLQGADAWWVRLPAGAGGRLASLMPRPGATAADLDVRFYGSACNLLGDGGMAGPAASETGTVPAGARWAAVALASGARAPFALTVFGAY